MIKKSYAKLIIQKSIFSIRFSIFLLKNVYNNFFFNFFLDKKSKISSLSFGPIAYPSLSLRAQPLKLVAITSACRKTIDNESLLTTLNTVKNNLEKLDFPQAKLDFLKLLSGTPISNFFFIAFTMKRRISKIAEK